MKGTIQSARMDATLAVECAGTTGVSLLNTFHQQSCICAASIPFSLDSKFQGVFVFFFYNNIYFLENKLI